MLFWRSATDFLKRLADSGVSALDPQDESILLRKRIRLVNLLSIFCAALCFFSLPFDYMNGPTWIIWEDILGTILYLPIIYLNKRGAYAAARLLFFLLSNAFIFANASVLGPHSGFYVCFFGLAAFALTLFDLRETLLLGTTLALPIIEFFFLTSTGFTFGSGIPPEVAGAYSRYSATINFMALVITIHFLKKVNDESENALKGSRFKAIQSAKMAALGEMSSGIAHEINNPLMGIQLNASLLKALLKDEKTPSSRFMEAIQKIDRLVARATKVTHALQIFSRSDERDPMIKASVKEIVADTVDLCGERFKNGGVSLEVAPVSENLSLTCRPVQISQVLLNLLNNAFSAVADLPEKWVRIDIEQSQSLITIQVTDSGHGISKEIQEKMFDPFFTTKAPGHGTGLGLSISRGVVEEHGGVLSLNLESKHTQFFVQFKESS